MKGRRASHWMSWTKSSQLQKRAAGKLIPAQTPPVLVDRHTSVCQSSSMLVLQRSPSRASWHVTKARRHRKPQSRGCYLDARLQLASNVLFMMAMCCLLGHESLRFSVLEVCSSTVHFDLPSGDAYSFALRLVH